MCSHCGECFRFGVAKLARVLLFWLVCPLVLGLISFVLVTMVVVFKLIGGGFVLVYNAMSCICCLMTCIPVVFISVVDSVQLFVTFWCDMVFPSISLCCCHVCWWCWCGRNYYSSYRDSLYEDFVELNHFCTIPM